MNSTAASAEWYSWVERQGPEGVCITLARSLALRDALAALSADAASEHQTDFRSAEAEWRLDAMPLQVDQANGALVFVEPNGWTGSEPERLAALSRAARAVSVYWNVNAVMTFLVADNGHVVRSMDPLLYEAEDALPEEAELPFGVGLPRAAALALLYRLTGFEVTAAWLMTETRSTYMVRSVR